MTAHDIIAKLRANADMAELRRSEFRSPVIRPWGIAAGTRPVRVRAKPEVVWRTLSARLTLLLFAVGFCIGFCAKIFWL